MRLSSLTDKPTAIPLFCQPNFIERKINLKVTKEGLSCFSAQDKKELLNYSFATKEISKMNPSFTNNDFDSNHLGFIYSKMKQSTSDIMRTSSQ